jgi:phosphatidylglycerophosphatase A
MTIRNRLVVTLSTFFYVGYLPFIPGTYASIAGIFLYYLVKDNLYLHILSTFILIFLGFLVSGKAEKIFNRKDARYIVIDEVAGMLLSLIFVSYNVKLLIIAFFLFRIFDALKPYPAARIQNLKGSLGVMGDDIVAALYTNIIIQLVLRFASFSAS